MASSWVNGGAAPKLSDPVFDTIEVAYVLGTVTWKVTSPFALGGSAPFSHHWRLVTLAAAGSLVVQELQAGADPGHALSVIGRCQPSA